MSSKLQQNKQSVGSGLAADESKVLSIYEAKTNLSKLVKRAKAGEVIYIGAYGKPEVVISLPEDKPKGIKFGALTGHFDDFDFDEFQALDSEIKWDVLQ